jgi:hypothetical protein
LGARHPDDDAAADDDDEELEEEEEDAGARKGTGSTAVNLVDCCRPLRPGDTGTKLCLAL